MAIEYQYEELRFELRVENNCGQEVHCSLFYFSPDYAIYFVDYRVIPNNRAALFMEDTLTIIEGKSQSTEQLKIFVGTEKMDDFLLEMSPKETGETVNYTVTRNLELAGQKAIGSFYSDFEIFQKGLFRYNIIKKVQNSCCKIIVALTIKAKVQHGTIRHRTVPVLHFSFGKTIIKYNKSLYMDA